MFSIGNILAMTGRIMHVHYDELTEISISIHIIKNDSYMCSTFKTLCLLVSSADNFCKQFGPDQARQNVGPDEDQNYLTRWWYSRKKFV